MEGIDGLAIMVGVLFAIGFIILAFVMGRWLDPIWRCKFLRKLTKKDYVVLNIKSSDGRTIETRVVNAEGETVLIGTNLWTIEKGKVYLKYKPQTGLGIADFIKEQRTEGKEDKDIKAHLDRISDENKGFLLKNSKYQYIEEGAPTIYVDYDSIKPLGFEGDKTTVKPAEVGATILSLVLVRTHKALATVADLSMIQKLIAFGLAINLILTFLGWSAAQEARDEVLIIKQVITTGSVSAGAGGGGTMVIKQPSG